MIQYRYTVRKSGWPYSDDKFSQLRKWARTQRGFWWNFMDGDHALFSFWARPEELLKAATEIIGHPPGEVCGIEIDVDRSVLPKHELTEQPSPHSMAYPHRTPHGAQPYRPRKKVEEA